MPLDLTPEPPLYCIGTLDVSWRGDTRGGIPAIVLRPEADEVPLRDAEAFGSVRTEHGNRYAGRRACLKWQMSTTGYVWLANSYSTCHGDEHYGRLDCPVLGTEWQKYHAPMAYGAIGFEPTRLVVLARSFWRSKSPLTKTPHALARSLVEQHHGFAHLLFQAADVAWEAEDLRWWRSTP